MVPFLTPPNNNRTLVRFFYGSQTALRRLKAAGFLIIGLCVLTLCLTLQAEPQKPVVRLLIKMLPEQEKWFKENVLRPFEKSQNVTIEVNHFVDYDDLERQMSSDSFLDVIKVPMDRAESIREKELIRPLSDIADPATLTQFRRDFILPPLAVAEGALYYLPRKLETRIMVYRVSKVAEAVLRYKEFLPELDKLVKSYSGHGMPFGFVLKPDPNQWDYYDVLMAGFTWSKLSKGDHPGKIGHRGKNYSGTFLRLVDRAFQFGAIRGEIPYPTSKAVEEVFVWECFYAKTRCYNDLMFKEAWTGSDLWKAFGEEKIYLGFLTQLDCFMLMGTGENGLNGFTKTPDDIDFAVMPQAASLSGNEFMLANRNVTTNGWFWGIGRNSKDPQLALKLIMHMTSIENQKKEFEAFGVLSARRELLAENRDELYLKRWRNRLLQTSIRQINLNRFTIMPTYKDMDYLQNKYYRILFRLCSKPEDVFGIENVHTAIIQNDN